MIIEKNIPVPSSSMREHIKVFPRMVPGDSILVTERCETVLASAYSYARRNKKQFASKKIGKYVRIWRVK